MQLAGNADTLYDCSQYFFHSECIKNTLNSHYTNTQFCNGLECSVVFLFEQVDVQFYTGTRNMKKKIAMKANVILIIHVRERFSCHDNNL